MKKEKFIRRFFISKIFFLISVLVFGFLLVSLMRKIIESREINHEIRVAEEEIARLEAKNSEMNSLLSYLNTDIFLEQEAREKFNLQKAGESVMVLPENNRKDSDNKFIVQKDDGAEEAGNPEKWWNYFFQSRR